MSIDFVVATLVVLLAAGVASSVTLGSAEGMCWLSDKLDQTSLSTAVRASVFAVALVLSSLVAVAFWFGLAAVAVALEWSIAP